MPITFKQIFSVLLIMFILPQYIIDHIPPLAAPVALGFLHHVQRHKPLVRVGRFGDFVAWVTEFHPVTSFPSLPFYLRDCHHRFAL